MKNEEVMKATNLKQGGGFKVCENKIGQILLKLLPFIPKFSLVVLLVHLYVVRDFSTFNSSLQRRKDNGFPGITQRRVISRGVGTRI